MSSRSRHYSDEDVESYRQRSRQNDRRHRDHEDDDDDAERKKQLARDREERMTKLRDQLKKEDETLAALGKQQQEQAQQEKAESNKISPQEAVVEVQPEELEGLDPEEQMLKLMGIGSFGSTKGEAVADNQSTAARGGAAKNKARKYRQYMNRKSGFNRPLQKMN